MSHDAASLKILHTLSDIHRRLEVCRRCTEVCGTPVTPKPIVTKCMAIGQAPGIHESKLGRPFAFTAGKTLFKWLKIATDLEEDELRERIYFTAVARCFPGRAKYGTGDREPNTSEIKNCRENVRAEVQALRPRVLFVIGRVALTEVLGPELFTKQTPLHEVVGKSFKVDFHGVLLTAIPLPHPSGVSRWPQTEPGKTKLKKALKIIKKEFKNCTK